MIDKWKRGSLIISWNHCWSLWPTQTLALPYQEFCITSCICWINVVVNTAMSQKSYSWGISYNCCSISLFFFHFALALLKLMFPMLCFYLVKRRGRILSTIMFPKANQCHIFESVKYINLCFKKRNYWNTVSSLSFIHWLKLGKYFQ